MIGWGAKVPVIAAAASACPSLATGTTTAAAAEASARVLAAQVLWYAAAAVSPQALWALLTFDTLLRADHLLRFATHVRAGCPTLSRLRARRFHLIPRLLPGHQGGPPENHEQRGHKTGIMASTQHRCCRIALLLLGAAAGRFLLLLRPYNMLSAQAEPAAE